MVKQDLTASQRIMLRCSGHDPKDGNGYGVRLQGAGNWATARALEAMDLGWIEGGHSRGPAASGLFFANRDGVAAVVFEPEVQAA